MRLSDTDKDPHALLQWGLIDQKGEPLTESKYLPANWINAISTRSSYHEPGFLADLAPVTRREDQTAGETWQQRSWGYVDKAGNIIKWHN